MTTDSSDPAKPAVPGEPPGSGTDTPPRVGPRAGAAGQDVDPATIETDEDDEARLPEMPAETTPQDAAAWTLTARVLLNLDETISKR